MGLFSKLFGNNEAAEDKRSAPVATSTSQAAKKASVKYADSRSISPDERAFYKPDDYYTLEKPGISSPVRVITFEERKKISYPTKRGLYVAEVKLLEYCKKGNYPKPNSGYPGLWWFEFGIRDVGHALESLAQRGFIQWAPKSNSVRNLKTDELKQILSSKGLPNTGKKKDLVDRILNEIPEDQLVIPNYVPKYELTALGESELEDNGYIPYLGHHRHLTTEDAMFGEPFNVWMINKLFPDGNASNWRQVVGEIEERRFGVNMANAIKDEAFDSLDLDGKRNAIRQYLNDKQNEIQEGIKKPGDGYEEESQGLDYFSIGKDKEGLVKMYISIGKGFDAPALYRETSEKLCKYEMYQEAISVLDAGLRRLPDNNGHRNELIERKAKIKSLLRA